MKPRVNDVDCLIHAYEPLVFLEEFTQAIWEMGEGGVSVREREKGVMLIVLDLKIKIYIFFIT